MPAMIVGLIGGLTTLPLGIVLFAAAAFSGSTINGYCNVGDFGCSDGIMTGSTLLGSIGVNVTDPSSLDFFALLIPTAGILGAALCLVKPRLAAALMAGAALFGFVVGGKWFAQPGIFLLLAAGMIVWPIFEAARAQGAFAAPAPATSAPAGAGQVVSVSPAEEPSAGAGAPAVAEAAATKLCNLCGATMPAELSDCPHCSNVVQAGSAG